MSLETLTTWRGLLEDLGSLGTSLCDAIDADDVVGAISAMMQLRRTRSSLARVETPLTIAGELAELHAMRDVAEAMLRARGADVAMTRWLARPLPGDARLLASPLGIAVLADALLPAVWDFETDLVVLVGAGLTPVGDVLADLGQRRILLLDPEAASTVAINATSVDEAAAAVRTMVPGVPSQFVVRSLVGSAAGLAEEVRDAVQSALSDLRVHRNTVHAFSRTWFEQGLANLPALARCPSIADVGEAFAGVPMVIVAPGPSLAKNAAQLRELRGRAIITAFSHSLKPVLAAGVTPDLILTVDPQDVRYHFAGCDISSSCLVNAATCHPALFELPAARYLSLSANSAIDDWLFDGLGGEALVPGGGSVATSAFSLALRWHCDPIVFVGLDLSFPGGEYYVATSSDGGARANVDANGIMRVDGWSDAFHTMKSRGGPAAMPERCVALPGWHGGTVPSSFMFSMFHRWFVEQMHLLADASSTTRVFNCTEGGAFIEGMQHVPLADVIPQLPLGIAPADVLARTEAAMSPTRLAHLVSHLEMFVAGLRRARTLGRLARKVIARGQTGPRLARIERALSETLRPLEFVSLLAQREVERADVVARHDGSERDFLKASVALMTTLDKVIDKLEPALLQALQRLRPGRQHGSAA